MIQVGDFVRVDDPLCRQFDPDTFYPDPGYSQKPALAICQGCHVLDTCREQTLLTDLAWTYEFGHGGGLDSIFGVQAGMTAAQRTSIVRLLRGEEVAEPQVSDVSSSHADCDQGTSSMPPAGEDTGRPDAGRLVRGSADREDAPGREEAA